MKKSILSIILAFVAIFTVTAQEPANDAFKQIRYADKAFNYTNQVTFTKEGDGQLTRFVNLFPVPRTNEYQIISNLSCSDGQVIVENKYGNHVLVVDIKDFPGQQYVHSYTFDVQPIRVKVDVSKITETRPYNPNSEPCRKYLGDRGEYVMTRHPFVVHIGDSIWAQSANVLDYARRCYEYVASHFRYIHGTWRTLDKIIEEGGGECGDFTTLTINLLRYKGIPSRHNICVRPIGEYHVWGDFYLEGYGWIPFDTQMKNACPNKDYFGYYNGSCIIVMQDIGYEITKGLPTYWFHYFYKYWYSGSCKVNNQQIQRLNGETILIDKPVTTHVIVTR